MLDISLEWSRCPDGVEIRDYGLADPGRSGRRVRTVLGGAPEGRYWEPQSPRRSPVMIEAVDLENPVCLQLVNSKSDDDVRQFYTRFGMLSSDDWEDESLFAKERDQLLSDIAGSLGTSRAERSRSINEILGGITLLPGFDYLGHGNKGRIVLKAKSLLHFMRAEAAYAAISEVEAVRCGGCEKLFFRGLAAKRRADAKTCSARCRTIKSRREATART